MKLKSVLLTTYQSAFLFKSGGENEMLRLNKEFKKQNILSSTLGNESTDLTYYENVLHFGSEIEAIDLIKKIKKYKIKTFLIPNLWFIKEPSKAQINQYQYFFNLFDTIVFKSNAEKFHLKRYFQFKNIIDIKTGIDRSFQKTFDVNAFKNIYGIDKYVFSHGTIEKRKNQLTICKALKNTKIPFVFAGNIRDEDYFEKCKKILGKKFIYLGNLDQNEDLLQAALFGCKIFVEIPLDYPGVSSLEAAYLNKFMILSNDNWSKEHIKKNVEYINPMDYSKLEKIIKNRFKYRNLQKKNYNNFHKFIFPKCIKNLINKF